MGPSWASWMLNTPRPSTWIPVAAPPFSMAAKHVSRHCRMSAGEGAEGPPARILASMAREDPETRKTTAPSVLLQGHCSPPHLQPRRLLGHGHPRDLTLRLTMLTSPSSSGIQGGPVPATSVPRALEGAPGGPGVRLCKAQGREPGFGPWSGN